MTQETALTGFAAEATEPKRRGAFASVLRALLRRKLALLSLVYIAIFYSCGLFAPLIAPQGYTQQNLDSALQSPSWDHPFGTDRLGRDMLSRTIYATRTTLIITVISVITGGLIIGPGLGLLAGYRRGGGGSALNTRSSREWGRETGGISEGV